MLCDRLYFACQTRKPSPGLCVSIVFVLPLLAGNCCGQFALPAIDSLPNAPATYQMRDWHQTAIDFDALAFDTTATGQYLPLVRIDNTPESPQLQNAFGLPAYVGETRTFGENGEPVHEAIASLAAVLGGTFVGVDKSAGPNNWVSMGAGVLRQSQWPVHCAQQSFCFLGRVGMVRHLPECFVLSNRRSLSGRNLSRTDHGPN